MQLCLLRVGGRFVYLRKTFGDGAQAENLLFLESKGRGCGKRKACRDAACGKRFAGKGEKLIKMDVSRFFRDVFFVGENYPEINCERIPKKRERISIAIISYSGIIMTVS
jgi:hypothetical protein